MLRRRRGVRELRLGADDSDDRTDALTDVPDAAPSMAEATIEADRFDRAFARLSVDERALLVLRHRDDESVEGIASRLGIPPGTVKSRLFAARRALERALEREDR